MAKMFIYDLDGNIVETKVKGRGRPPMKSTTDENGDIHVHPSEEFQVQYVTVAVDGSVTRENKSRGRTRRGYELMTEGEFVGHYLMTETVVPATTEDEMEGQIAEAEGAEAEAEGAEGLSVAKAAK